MGTVVHSELLSVELMCRKITIGRKNKWVMSPFRCRWCIKNGCLLRRVSGCAGRQKGMGEVGADMCIAAVLSVSWYCQNDAGITQCCRLHVD